MNQMKGVLGMYSADNIFGLTYGAFFGGSCTISIVKMDDNTGLCAITGGNGYPEEVEFPVPINSIEIIRETLEKICLWNNKYTCPHDILDGFGWEVKFVRDGKTIRKSGYMAYPENYNDVMQELIRFVEELKKEALPIEKRFLPLNPFETSGHFVPIGEKKVKEEHYRKIRFKPGIRLWSPSNQMY